MLLCGIGSSNISAPNGTPLGGYWGRDPLIGSTGVNDALFCRVLTLHKLNANGTKNWTAIVSLDLIGLTAKTCQLIKNDLIAAVQGPLTLSSSSIMISCTHTHTGPQTHQSFIGMGHADKDVYIASILRTGIVTAFQESIATLTPATMYHGKTRPLTQVSINRRQRTPQHTEAQPATSTSTPSTVKWFEKAGRTSLGQNPVGPKMESAEVIQFVQEDNATHILATVIIYACHPTTVGPLLNQSSDFCGALVASMEAHTQAPAMYLNGCCGDVNPFHHRSGYSGAAKMGQRIALAAIQTLQNRSKDHLYGLACIDSTDIDLTTSLKKIKLPVNPLPSAPAALLFLQQQESWLQEEQDNHQGSNAATLGARTAAPRDCCSYAQNIHQECLQNTSSTSNTATTDSIAFRIQGISLGPIALVGMEGEMFSEYQLSIDRASPFEKSTIVLGYTNGCIGYVPTENEYSFGGYECCHSFRVYGRSTDICPTSERLIMRATLSMLQELKYNVHTLSIPALKEYHRRKQLQGGSGKKQSLVYISTLNTFDHTVICADSIGTY